MASLAQIQSNNPQSMGTVPGSGQNLTVSNSVVTLAAAAVPARTKMVMIEVQAEPVRLTTDGVDPTGSKGRILAAGTVLYLSERQANAAKFLRNGGTDATVYSEALTY